MHETIHRGECHRLVGEHLFPRRERRVGGDRDALALVALRDKFEEHGGLGLIAAHVAQIVEDQEIESIELGQLPLADADRGAQPAGVAPVRRCA